MPLCIRHLDGGSNKGRTGGVDGTINLRPVMTGASGSVHTIRAVLEGFPRHPESQSPPGGKRGKHAQNRHLTRIRRGRHSGISAVEVKPRSSVTGSAKNEPRSRATH